MMQESKAAEALQDEKFRTMTQKPVGRLIAGLAVPSILSMMTTAVYNLCDSWFVSQVGDSIVSTHAVAALGVIFSYQTLGNAVGFFFGHGSGNYISRALGRKERSKASEMAAAGVFSSFIAGLILGFVGFLASEPFLRLLGANSEILPEALQYFTYIALATPFLTTQLTLNNQLRLQGNARLGMIGIMSGAILNIALDAIFIFYLNMGIQGASLATAISQFIACSILLIMTHVGDGIPPKLSNFHPSIIVYKEIFAGGLPSLSRQGLNALATVVLNRYAVHYGADPLAALSIVSRLNHMVLCIAIGVGQGFQPVCGFNYGAKLYNRVKQAYYFGIKLNTIILSIGFVILCAFSSNIIALFGSSEAAAVIAVRTTRYYALCLPFLGFVVMTEMIHQNTRQTVRASLLAAMRQGIALIPAIIIMDAIWNLEGVLWAQSAANVVALCVSLPFSVQLMRKFNKLAEESK